MARADCFRRADESDRGIPPQDLEALSAVIGHHEVVSPRAAVDDWNAVLERVGGSRPLLGRLIGMACEELPELAAALRTHAFGDVEELRRVAHRAAGTAAMFDAGVAVGLMRALADCEAPSSPEERADMVARAALELERLSAELAAHMSEETGS